jgi:Fuc2NAc and GlcNAc transferase
MSIFLVLPVAAVLALLLTNFFRRYALSHDLLDLPNVRGSHSVPTPRGGGIAMAITFLLLVPLFSIEGDLPFPVVCAMLGGGFCVALIGFLDDHKHIAINWRLSAHFVGAIWAMYWFGGFPSVAVFGVVLNLGWIGNLLAVMFLVWLLNLYNFMDGIDGIASIEAITICMGASFLFLLQNEPQAIWLPPLLLSFTATGFLYWNFPRAKVFMGDAGSGFLGFMLGLFSIQGAWESTKMFWVWIILLGVFIVDATLTLFERIINGEAFYRAHCKHAYQVAARQYGSHKAVSLSIGVINLFWLLPVAYLVSIQWIDGILGVIIAFTPLVGLFLHFRANSVERT